MAGTAKTLDDSLLKYVSGGQNVNSSGGLGIKIVIVIPIDLDPRKKNS